MVSARFDEQFELKITISDCCVGIPKGKMESIYEEFTQESINNNRKFGGLGLGLSIVKKLVELYQGTIQMESKIGQGTTSHLYYHSLLLLKQYQKNLNYCLLLLKQHRKKTKDYIFYW